MCAVLVLALFIIKIPSFTTAPFADTTAPFAHMPLMSFMDLSKAVIVLISFPLFALAPEALVTVGPEVTPICQPVTVTETVLLTPGDLTVTHQTFSQPGSVEYRTVTEAHGVIPAKEDTKCKNLVVYEREDT